MTSAKALMAGLTEEVGARRGHVVRRDEQVGLGLGQALAGEKALECALEGVRVVTLVEQPLAAADALKDVAIEDLRTLVLVERDQLRGGQRVGGTQSAGEDAAGRGAGDEVEELEDALPGAPLDLGQHEGGNKGHEPPSIDR
jgi:hypothetical protein